MIRVLILFLLIFFVNDSFAQKKAKKLKRVKKDKTEERQFDEDDKRKPKKPVYYYFDYTVMKKDSFATIIKQFVKPTSIISAKTPMIIKTRKKNPHIKNWAGLKPGDTFRLYVSSDFLNKKAVKKYFKEKRPKSWRSPVFYMASLGTFTQEFDNGTVLNFYQNSPVSAGIASTWYPKQKNWSISSSAYVSFLKTAAGVVDEVKSEISVPPEIGGNVYWDYQMIGSKYNLYTGLDFERFSTFNKSALLEDAVLQLDTYLTFYWTVGWSKVFKVWKFPIFTKISISKTIASSPGAGGSYAASSEGYDGLKYMLYFNYRVKGPWFIHLLYKVHMMEGPDKLSTNRTGIGFGYNLK